MRNEGPAGAAPSWTHSCFLRGPHTLAEGQGNTWLCFSRIRTEPGQSCAQPWGQAGCFSFLPAKGYNPEQSGKDLEEKGRVDGSE